MAMERIAAAMGRSISAASKLPLYSVMVPKNEFSSVGLRNSPTASAAILYPQALKKNPKIPQITITPISNTLLLMA